MPGVAGVGHFGFCHNLSSCNCANEIMLFSNVNSISERAGFDNKGGFFSCLLDDKAYGDNEVDFFDYSTFAQSWLAYCSDDWPLKE